MNISTSFLLLPLSSPLSFVVFSCLGVSWVVAVFLASKESLLTQLKLKRWFDWLFLLGVGFVLLELVIIFWEGKLLWQSSYSVSTESFLTQMTHVIYGLAFLVSVLGFWSLPFMVSVLIIKVFFKRQLPAWLSRSLLLLPGVPLLLLMGLFALFLIDDQNGLFASRYFKLHAAIKNTCLLDPKRDHCPAKLEELSYIEPEEFKRLAAHADFIYTYDSATNQYTFIVRPYAKRAVVFDQRLVPLIGVDFREYEVVTDTTGQDHLQDPPPFPGPWELPDFMEQHTWKQQGPLFSF